MTVPRLLRSKIGRLFKPTPRKQLLGSTKISSSFIWSSGAVLDSLLTAHSLRDIPGFFLPSSTRSAYEEASLGQNSTEAKLFRSIAEVGDAPSSSNINIDTEIGRLARRGNLVQANRLYDALQSSGAPLSDSVQRALLDESLKHSDVSAQEEIFATIMDALREERILWNDNLLIGILNFFMEASRPDLMEELIRDYSVHNGPEWMASPEICAIMIHAHCEAGQGVAGLPWLDVYRQSGSSIRDSKIQPYLRLMRAFSDPSLGDPQTCYSIFRQMVGDGVQPTISAFTILMAMEARRKSFRRVFALKRAVAVRGLRPDAVMFATLFKSLEEGLDSSGAWKKTKRIPSQKHPKHPPSSARQLFLEMLISHLNQTHSLPMDPSPFVSASTLTVALRCFTCRRDYPAAMVVLRCFEACRLIPTARSEWAVVAPILKRIQGTIGFVWNDPSATDPGYRRWVERMRGRLTDVRSAKKQLREVRKLFEDIRPKQGRKSRSLVSDPALASARQQAERGLPPVDGDDIGVLTWVTRPKKVKERVTDAPADLRRSYMLLQQIILADLSALGIEGLAAERTMETLINDATKDMLPFQLSEPRSRR